MSSETATFFTAIRHALALTSLTCLVYAVALYGWPWWGWPTLIGFAALVTALEIRTAHARKD